MSQAHTSSPLLRVLALAMGALTLGGVSLVLLLMALQDTWATVQAPGPARPADGLLLCVTGAGTLLLAWLALGLLLSLLSALPSATGAVAGRGAARIAPAAVRRVAAIALGATLATGTTTAATATHRDPVRPVASGQARGAPSATWPISAAPGRAAPRGPAGGVPPVGPAASNTGPDTAPDAAWTPPEPDRRPVADPDALDLLSRAPAAGGLVDEAVVVRRGDTLWSIAGRHLGPSATAEEIAREWPRWHDANRHAIGADPDLLQPGQVLQPPVPATGTP